MRVIIAAAGTAGHINPGIAIANKIKKEENDSEIIFIGTTRGLENDLVPRAGYKLKTIDAYGLSKNISIDNLKKMIKTAKGFSEARKIIDEFKPDIVIGTGGYICGAVITAAHKRKIPTVLHESNAFPGKAVKALAKNTDTILLGFKETEEKIKKAKNIVYTGTPVKIKKINYTDTEKKKIIQDLGLSTDKPIILIFGGSQGAQKINEAITGIIKNNLNKNYQLIWATGPKQYDVIKEKLEDLRININGIQNAKIVPYIYDMEQIMNISDVIVSRSGAMTITEIATLGKPSILIPLPNVSNNHQYYNAMVLKNNKAAEIILNEELQDENVLNKEINKIINSKDNMKKMGEKALQIANNDAENKIYYEINKLVKK